MKIFYLTILTFFLSISVYGQTVVDFTAEEGYEQGALDNNADWGGANWIASPNNSRIECAGGYSWARWGVPFTVDGSEITFEIHFRFNIDLPPGKLILRTGFNNGGSSSGTIANIQLSTLNDGSLSVRKQNNVPVDEGYAGLTDFQQDDLVLKVTITLGSDAESSTLSANITNTTDDLQSNIAFINGIPIEVFTAATSGGISGFIHAQDAIGGTRNILVDKVIMTQGNTLGSRKVFIPEFTLLSNPIGDTVEISGIEIGNVINIYTVTGAKASTHVFNGSSLNLSHLDTGVYFMETPGFATKKIIKN